jgi:site-specific DNA-methyltransferase (adenine-specific)
VRKEVIGMATLYLADCLTVLPDIDADVLITDPPYGVELGSHDGANESRPGWLVKGAYESYQDTEENLLKVVVPAISLAVQKFGRGLVFCADKHINKFPSPNAIGGVYIPAACGRNAFGFASLAHALMYGSAPGLNKGAKSTVLRSTATAEKNGHPCPKPVEWMVWAASLASADGETVCDPFMGSGTTGVACMQLGRKFVGIEIEPSYFDIACERIDNAQRQERLFA